MAARTYQPSLRRLCHQIYVFIGRYQALLAQGMTSEQAAYLTALSLALQNMLNSLGTGGGV